MLGLQRKDQKSISLKSTDILCLAIFRNETLRLPFFFNYYRQKGITHFLIVDNNSDDGTLDYLLAQSDTYVWYSGNSFKNKLTWLEWLLKTYGKNHWCLIVDADEILYYPHCEQKTIKDLCFQLEKQRKNALQVIMLDMYSQLPIQEVKYQEGTDFLNTCPYFDRHFYHHQGGIIHNYYWGGLRQRVFGKEGLESSKCYCLTKFPLIKDHGQMQLYSEHMVKNIKRSSTTGCFLHFKYFASFIDYVKQESQREEHWQEAIEYKKYAQLLAKDEDLSLYDEELSIKLENSQQLIEMGIISIGYTSYFRELLFDFEVKIKALIKLLVQKLK